MAAQAWASALAPIVLGASLSAIPSRPAPADVRLRPVLAPDRDHHGVRRHPGPALRRGTGRRRRDRRGRARTRRATPRSGARAASGRSGSTPARSSSATVPSFYAVATSEPLDELAGAEYPRPPRARRRTVATGSGRGRGPGRGRDRAPSARPWFATSNASACSRPSPAQSASWATPCFAPGSCSRPTCRPATIRCRCCSSPTAR